MTSKEALERLFDDLRQFEEHFVGCVCSDTKEELNTIEKDLEILECFRKIPKQDLLDFINWQIRYEKNMKTWLEERHFCYIGKEEEYTKHLIKIKEWLENDK